MADPPVTQEAGQLPEKQSNVSAKLSICFGRHPDTEEIYCTTQGANSRRLLQARQEHSLNVVHRPQPEHPHRPQDLFDIMPLPTRRLNMSSTYFLNKSKTKRVHVSVVITSEFRLLPKPEVHAMSPNPKRAHFNIGDPDLDIPTIRFLQSAIGNICERLPSHILLGELDERLKTFIIDTARRHAAQTTRLPAIFVTVPVDGQPITVKTTVHVLSRSHTSEMPEVRSHVIELELQRIPRAKCTLEIPANFELPHLPMLRPASDIGGHDEETQQRAFRVLSWISAHTIHRVFEPDSFDSYVDYLKRLACLGSSSDQEISRHGGEEDVVMKDVQVGDGATVTGDTTEKAISISSGIEESSDEEDSSDEDEVSDEDMFGDEEDLHIDYGYGPADPEELAAQARQYLEDLSDDELDSQVSSDEEDDTDDDIDVDFEDLIPEAQAEEIAAVYQHIAVLLTGDAKADLLANAKQVLMAGSMLAKSLRKQEQGDDYESSAESSDVEMLDQTTPEAHTSEHKDKLQIFKGLPAYVKGIWLAKGAEDASNLLQKDAHNVDNVDIVRRLHLYAGRAIRLCKQLHEADSPPHDDNPALYESMPSLRGRQRGLRLGAVYRGHANFLLETKRNDNASDLCNLFLCGSYVTEMGWQLDDLQAAQTEHDSTVTALETRNKTLGARNGTLETQNTTLQAQVDQLQEQLQALKIENAAARPDASAALSGPELYEQLRKFLVPEQATTGDRDQMMDTSDTLVGDVASDMPAVQVQQDVDMTGTAGSPPDVLPNTPAKDPKPGPKSDPKISSTVSLPAASEHVDSEVDTSVAPKPVSKLDAFHEARGLSFDDLHAKTSPHPNGKGKAPSPSKAAGSPTKASTKQPKGGVPSFMSTTAATAAKSRAPMSKPGATAETRPQTSAAIRPTTRPSTRAATRAGTRADDQASARPETPIEQSASRGQPAPATREEPHTGGRRRIGHVPDVSPPSPSATPTKKQRKAGAKKGGK